MYKVYLLKSKVKNWFYVGMTANIDERIKRHNQGKERATKPYAPFTMVYSKEFTTRIRARDYEKYQNTLKLEVIKKSC